MRRALILAGLLLAAGGALAGSRNPLPTPVPVSMGGTGATTGSGAATNLSLPWVACHATGAQPTTQSTSIAPLVACKIPGGLLGTSGCVEVYTRWRPTTQNGVADLLFSATSGTTGTSIYATTLTAGTDYSDTRKICNINSASAQDAYGGNVATLSSTTAPVAPTIDTAADAYVNLAASVTSGGTMTLEQYTVTVEATAGN